ncbi:MAG: hypothetical protein PHD73_00075 [Sediminibacterium sp.]|nr:hypothetical protein [Sediminibacterium sp.]
MEELLLTNPISTTILQQVDPMVSRSKFDRELSYFMQVKDYNMQRGVVLIDAEFPFIKLAFYAYRIKPLILAFAIRLDFTNYDLEPPSLRFIDFLTDYDLTHPELYINLTRFQMDPLGEGNPVCKPLQDLIQSHKPKNIPFVCLPGIKEYHSHPSHSNDSWLSRKGKGEGTLGFIIDQLHKYGTEPLNGILPVMANIQQINPAGMLIQFAGITFTRDKNPL